MSYTPPHSHNRHSSLATVYEDNDPYRIVKKSPRIGSISDNSSDFDAVHSRTASDSSTSRLYSGQVEFGQDPYANCKKKLKLNEERANSYLPYSHHERDPRQQQSCEPMYIEEENGAPASTTLGMGSILCDTMMELPASRIKEKQVDTTLSDDFGLSTQKRRKRRRTVCGMRYRSLVLICLLFITTVVIIWYFVWPRIPNLALDDVDNLGTIQVLTNSTKKSMSTQWVLNMTADNTANWVPTRINAIDIIITDDKTKESFGTGSSGWLVLPPKKKTMIPVFIDIYYETYNVNDTTFQDLYNACGVQVNSNAPFESKQGVLNVTLSVTYHISGIVWPTTKQMHIDSLICPTS
ncbi:uncharacterized protein EV154DRAFT_532422 [Mucor mucedo]|uniref:uncharacterized protein n=1 Tax=Mucor mucedo TaxID=29922 RepID=UPI0022206A3E|nr:uncharacterized protein EV154DRAFT_532422 [Mucor mucedo]KAI7866924.1 hypothetical protein EV154DRAFT_532422 [Mucor mucedo]